MLNVLNKESNISLRIIDYLCTNYAKHKDVVYFIGNRKAPFNLYLDYRSQLKAYSKLQFDPFKRHARIIISVPTNLVSTGKLETTVAQLNFFRWLIDCKVLEYLEIEENYKNIDKHMSQSSKKNVTVKKKESTFTAAAKRHNLSVTVTFQ